MKLVDVMDTSPRTILATCLALLACMVLPAASLAAAPRSPDAGTRTESTHPVLSWQLGADEHTDVIAVADAPDTTPDGMFWGEHVVVHQPLDPDQTSWAPVFALPAGTYWWHVLVVTDKGGASRTESRSFTILPSVRSGALRLVRYRDLHDIEFNVSWWSNVESGRMLCEVRAGSRRVWARHIDLDALEIGMRNAQICDFATADARGVHRGQRLRFIAAVRSGSHHVRVVRRFRAL